MARETARPVEALREYATQLEAAMTVALSKPRKGAVHKLRSLSRRLEAQLALLQQMDAVPADSEEAAEFARRLRKLRRAAGVVRDLDVQRELLKTESGLPAESAEELRTSLKQTRRRKAAKLQEKLKKQLPRIAAAIEGLLQSVGTANGMAIPDLRLVPLIERWAESQEGSTPPEGGSDDQLHTARKVVKTARYMAEGLGGSPKAARTAARYEALQEAGGRWHDWLDLTETAREHFGKKHALTQAAKDHCEAARTEYLKLLG